METHLRATGRYIQGVFLHPRVLILPFPYNALTNSSQGVLYVHGQK